MNIPPHRPPPRQRRGPKSRLTPMQTVDLWSWYQAKCAIGTFKTKAREMGLPLKTLHDAVRNLLAREQRQAERIRRANGVGVDFDALPF